MHVGEKEIPFAEGSGHPMYSFATIQQTEGPVEELECVLTATYGWIDPNPPPPVQLPPKARAYGIHRKTSISYTNSAPGSAANSVPSTPFLSAPPHIGRRSSITANMVNDNMQINTTAIPVGQFATAILGSKTSFVHIPQPTLTVSGAVSANASVNALSSLSPAESILKSDSSVETSNSPGSSENSSVIASPNLSANHIPATASSKSGTSSPSWMVSPKTSRKNSNMTEGNTDSLAASQAFVQNPYVSEDGKILTNDPNNDGYFVLNFPGLCIGSVVDGSGYGHRARLASNIVLAYVNELSTELVVEFERARDTGTMVQSTFIQKWLQKVIIQSHRRIKEIIEAGATTLTVFVITRIANSRNYLCSYVVAGDTEGYYYSEATEQWKPLFKDPALNEAVRLDTSITPGGLGGYHGDNRRIFGLYLWSDEDWGEPNTSTDPFPTKTSNLHFGQVLLGRNDKIVFASDGLGDVIDPARIFLKPSCAHECAKL